MIDGETGMALIREALEGAIEPRAASAVIFEALAHARGAELPNDPESLLEFAQGPLKDAVANRVGRNAARDVVERIEQVFSRMTQTGRRPRDSGSTLEVPVTSGPVRVLVISARPNLAMALRMSLGGDRVAVGTSDEVPKAAALGGRIKPDVWIVDAEDPIADSLDSLVTLLEGAKAAAARLVWASEQPWGASLAALFESKGVSYVPVDRREGVDPLLDFIRSRRN